MKIDRKALGKAVGICAMSWLAIPVIYYLLVRKKKDMKEEAKDDERDNILPE